MSKRSNTMFLIFTITIIISFTLQTILNSVISATQTVGLSVTPKPEIDVVLAKSKTATDLIQFKTRLEQELEKRGIDKTKVKISDIQAQNVDISESFKWDQDVSPTIGSITISTDGKNVTMKGNRSEPGKNAIWIIPKNAQEQEFTFGYNIDYGDSFNAAGMLLRVQKNDNTLEGYMLSFNNSRDDNWQSAAGGQLGAIWKFTYVIGTNTSKDMQKVLLKPLAINKSGTLTVKVTETDITVEGGGLAKTTYTFEERYGSYGSGYGFFTNHYSHGCDEIGFFQLTGINLTTTDVRQFSDVLREPDWRENSIKVLVNVSDVSNKELNATNQMGELLARLLDESIHFVGWGNSQNKAEFENLIKTNSDKGLFINNTGFDASIVATADYIKSLIAEVETDNVYVLAENQIEFVSNPPEVFTNAKDGQYPYGKWKIIHDYNFYDNNLGQYEKSGMYIPDMEKSFNKTGKYTISFEDSPTNPEEIYVHRRPIALMKMTKTGNTITTTSESYDLDKYNDPDKGIAQIEWKYKKTSEQTWKNGQLTSITDDSDYIIQLRVKDHQNVWSRPVSMYATNNINAKPVASFRIKNSEITKYESLEIIDSSYDPYGGTIVERKWEVFKDGTEAAIQTTTNTLPNLKYTDIGNYTMKLTVKNNRGTYSEVFARKFTITEDSIPPSFTAEPESCDWKYSADVKLNFTDEGGSQFKEFEYAITESLDTPESYLKSNKQEDTITINEDGIKYLHVKATDNAGNTSLDRVLGPYHIDRTPPTGSIDYSPKTWVIDYVDLTYSFDDDKSGVDRVVLPNGQVTTNKTGTYRVTDNDVYNFTIYDKIGNSVVISKQITNIDHIKPVIGLTQKNTEWSAETTNISWECADNESGFREILLPDGTKSNKLTGEFTVKEQGIFTFIAYDNVGNEHKAKIQVQNIDKLPPTLELSQNVTKWVNDNVLINWSATDNESGLKQILLPDGKIVTEPTGSFTAKANGKYSFVAYDNLLNSVVKTIEIKNIDKIAPTIKFEFVQESIIDGKIKIRYTAEDNESGIKEILLPNGNKSTEQRDIYDITANGTYTFIAFDEAGNMKKGTIKIISFK